MPSYETLDKIADSYIPFLASTSIVFLIYSLFKEGWEFFATRSLLIFLGLLVTYCFVLADNTLKIWPKFGLDYSTHTALSLVFIIFLIINIPRFKLALIISLIVYFMLMLYQKYHSLGDIITTSFAVTLPFLFLILSILRNQFNALIQIFK